MTVCVPQPSAPLARRIQVTPRGGRLKLSLVEGQPVRIRLPVTTGESPKNMTGTAGRSPGRETSIPTKPEPTRRVPTPGWRVLWAGARPEQQRRCGTWATNKKSRRSVDRPRTSVDRVARYT